MALIDVIKFDGFVDRKWIVYKYHGQEFNDRSKVIVGPGQVALAVHGGKLEQIFESGTHVLSTENYPFLKGIVKAVHGGNVPYTMEIYYINKTIKLDMLWGTKDPVQVIDPKYGILVRTRARGQFGARLSNYQFFLTGLVGTMGGRNLLEFDVLSDYLRGLINTKVKTIIGEYIINNQISMLEISPRTEEISKVCFERLAPEMDRFGIELINFYIEALNVPQEDLDSLTAILNKKAELTIMGDINYRTVRGFDVMESAAKNEGGAGGIASAGIGLGMGLGMAGQMNSAMQNNTPLQNTSQTRQCPSCGKSVSLQSKFCPDCGSPMERKCPTCNSIVPQGMKFCPECGTKMN